MKYFTDTYLTFGTISKVENPLNDSTLPQGKTEQAQITTPARDRHISNIQVTLQLLSVPMESMSMDVLYFLTINCYSCAMTQEQLLF